MDAEVARDLEEAAAHLQVASTNARLQVADQYLERRFPNTTVAQRVLAGTFEPMRFTTGVLFLDVCGFTLKSWRMQSSEMAATIRRFAARMIAISESHLGWFYKFTGDGGVFIFTAGFTNSQQTFGPPEANAMVNAASEMRRVAREEFDWELRIGLHAGDVTWYVLEEGFSFEGTGKGLDLAARMEQAAGDGEILASAAVASDAFFEPSDRISRFGNHRSSQIKHGEIVGVASVLERSE